MLRWYLLMMWLAHWHWLLGPSWLFSIYIFCTSEGMSHSIHGWKRPIRVITVRPVFHVLVFQLGEQQNRTRTTSSTVLGAPLNRTRTRKFPLEELRGGCLVNWVRKWESTENWHFHSLEQYMKPYQANTEFAEHSCLQTPPSNPIHRPFREWPQKPLTQTRTSSWSQALRVCARSRLLARILSSSAPSPAPIIASMGNTPRLSSK